LSLQLTGALSVGRRLNRRKVLILTYHGVLPNGHVMAPFLSRNFVLADEFEWQMRYISARCTPISLSGAIDGLSGGAPLPDNPVAVTFDDGFRNNFTVAFPILQKHGIEAAVFLTTDHMGSGTQMLWTERVAWLLAYTRRPAVDLSFAGLAGASPCASPGDREATSRQLLRALKSLPLADRDRALDSIERQLRDTVTAAPDPERYGFLDWDEVRAMAAGGIEFGGHTMRHAVLSSLSPDERLAEVVGCKREIERQTDRQCTLFSYPNGTPADFDARDQQNLRLAGYKCAASQIPGLNDRGTDLFALKRLNVGQGHSRRIFAAQVSGCWRRSNGNATWVPRAVPAPGHSLQA
jgi:peptidoglycan/xylan/chitin deacetylase (PgdA/CDA1 family)